MPITKLTDNSNDAVALVIGAGGLLVGVAAMGLNAFANLDPQVAGTGMGLGGTAVGGALGLAQAGDKSKQTVADSVDEIPKVETSPPGPVGIHMDDVQPYDEGQMLALYGEQPRFVTYRPMGFR